jgi:hypothetical protein
MIRHQVEAVQRRMTATSNRKPNIGKSERLDVPRLYVCLTRPFRYFTHRELVVTRCVRRAGDDSSLKSMLPMYSYGASQYHPSNPSDTRCVHPTYSSNNSSAGGPFLRSLLDDTSERVVCMKQ